jgi:hypothetical protein
VVGRNSSSNLYLKHISEGLNSGGATGSGKANAGIEEKTKTPKKNNPLVKNMNFLAAFKKAKGKSNISILLRKKIRPAPSYLSLANGMPKIKKMYN